LQQKGVFEKIFAELTKEVVLGEVSRDSTFVKVHRHGLKGLERHIGKSKDGNNTKIHAAVDKQCRPIKLFLSAGNVNDIRVAPNLLERLSFDLTIIMADKAYCSRKFLRLIESKGGSPCIPCKKTYKRP